MIRTESSAACGPANALTRTPFLDRGGQPGKDVPVGHPIIDDDDIGHRKQQLGARFARPPGPDECSQRSMLSGGSIVHQAKGEKPADTLTPKVILRQTPSRARRASAAAVLARGSCRAGSTARNAVLRSPPRPARHGRYGRSRPIGDGRRRARSGTMIETLFGFFASEPGCRGRCPPSWCSARLVVWLTLPAPSAAGDRRARRGARGDRATTATRARSATASRASTEALAANAVIGDSWRAFAADPGRGARSRRRARRDAAAGGGFRRAHPGAGRGQPAACTRRCPTIWSGSACCSPSSAWSRRSTSPAPGSRRRTCRRRRARCATCSARRPSSSSPRSPGSAPRSSIPGARRASCIASASASSACAPRSTSAWSRSRPEWLGLLQLDELKAQGALLRRLGRNLHVTIPETIEERLAAELIEAIQPMRDGFAAAALRFADLDAALAARLAAAPAAAPTPRGPRCSRSCAGCARRSRALPGAAARPAAAAPGGGGRRARPRAAALRRAVRDLDRRHRRDGDPPRAGAGRVKPPLDRLRGAARIAPAAPTKALAELASGLRGLVAMRRELEAFGRMFREVTADFARAARRPSRRRREPRSGAARRARAAQPQRAALQRARARFVGRVDEELARSSQLLTSVVGGLEREPR